MLLLVGQLQGDGAQALAQRFVIPASHCDMQLQEALKGWI